MRSDRSMRTKPRTSGRRSRSKKPGIGIAERDLANLLVVLRDELCGGSWDAMTRELKARRAARLTSPKHARLAKRIDEDLAKIERSRVEEAGAPETTSAEAAVAAQRRRSGN